jgi:hypothetical protein
MNPHIATEDLSSRVASLQHSFNSISETEVQLKKLCTAVVRVAVAERPRQIALLNNAKSYVEKIRANAPQKMSKPLMAVANEITSLYEGVKSRSVEQSDITLLSGLTAVKLTATIKAEIQAQLTALSPVNTQASSTAEQLIQKNSKYRDKMPDLSKKDFGIARVPLAFSFSPTKGHSSVGYLSTEKLSQLGFKSDVLDGYAMVQNQVVIGINPSQLFDWEETTNEDGDTVRNAKPKTMTEKGITFKADKPTSVVKRRPKSALDAAREVKKLLESKTNVKYEFVSENPASFKGGSYFWLMATRDLSRFGQAFPGGHVKLSSWGFAF